MRWLRPGPLDVFRVEVSTRKTSHVSRGLEPSAPSPTSTGRTGTRDWVQECDLISCACVIQTWDHEAGGALGWWTHLHAGRAACLDSMRRGHGNSVPPPTLELVLFNFLNFIYYYYYYYYYYYWPRSTACRILVPWPGMEPMPPAVETGSLTTGPRGKSLFFFFFFFKVSFYLFYLWLCCVFVFLRGLSLVVASGGHSSSQCTGLSLSRPLLLRSTGSRRAGSVVVAHGSSCSTACGIFPDQGSNPCPLHWQADSQPLRHQGSPPLSFS